MHKTIEQQIVKFIKKLRLINSGDKLLLALSGGPDSVFALNFLLKYEKLFRFETAAAHLNHSLRGKNSDEDESFCAELCRTKGIKFHSVKVDVKSFAKINGLSVEEAGRIKRYKYFAGLCIQFGYNKIVTAHNADDNAETVLLNILQGTGINGLTGIPIVRGNIIRPFLVIDKKEILNWLNDNNIPFRTDSSNDENTYRRNYLRNEILPRVREGINPAVNKALINLSVTASNIEKIIEGSAEYYSEQYVVKSGGGINFKCDEVISTLGEEYLSEIIKNGLQKYFKYTIEFRDIEKIISLVNNQTGTVIQLRAGLTAVRERNGITISGTVKNIHSEIFLSAGESINYGDKKISIDIAVKKDISFKEGKTEFISADNTDKEFMIRKWKRGDKFIPLGMKSLKKVSDFLTESKIPASVKKDVPVLINRNNIVWIIGLRIDERYKVLPNTEKVLRLRVN